jgi:adenosylcobinamide-phosphate synthase
MRRHHPLVYFGQYAAAIEVKLNQPREQTSRSKWLGVLAWCCAVIPLTYGSYLIEQWLGSSGILGGYLGFFYAAILVYIAIGWSSLKSHAQAIIAPLKQGDSLKARAALAMIVSRDTQLLTKSQISSAATESVLENGADAVFSAIFWFIVLGVPGVVLYRLANTLDAMWGYKNSRYLHFGWAAARIDDALNFVPARLTAISYALLGNRACALQCWRSQGVNWKSPNAGPVMAAGAGAINVKLGGGSYYHGQWQERPLLGPVLGSKATATTIQAACFLVDRVLILWLMGLGLLAMCL